MVSLVFCDILQLPHTVISNSEKLTHPIVHVNVSTNVLPRFSFYELTFYDNFP